MSPGVSDILSPGGPVSASLDGFEQRPEQEEMAAAVEAAFAGKHHLIAEAGTGVGKSFAYLIPAILSAAEGGRRTVISTHTIALQEQLITKDLPFLAAAMDSRFTAVLGKGRGNYLCPRRLETAVNYRENTFASDTLLDQLEYIASWAMETRRGDISELPFSPSGTVWSRVCSDAVACMGTRCTYYERCFLREERRKLLKADIVVVNHALFFSDLPLPAEATLLGEYDFVVLDEAHTIESIATDHFGDSINNLSVAALIRQLYSEETGRGILSVLRAQDTITAAREAAAAAESFFAELAAAEDEDISPSGRIRRAEIIPDTVTRPLSRLAAALRRVNTADLDATLRFEIAALEKRVISTADTIARLLLQGEEQRAYWRTVHYTRGGNRRRVVTLAAAPINVAPMLEKLLFDSIGSVVLTSATLSTTRGGPHGFEYLRERLGIDDAEEILLNAPFDYRAQAGLYIETGLGDPNGAGFAASAAGAIRHYAAKTDGRCFVLTTSYRLLDDLFDELADWADEHRFRLLKQGGDLQRSAMLDYFREHGRSILLGTTSFWQGVDVVGEALSNVIITKLPFAVPTSPVMEARIEQIREDGGNPFTELQVPQAIIMFKQGFGRLIRSGADRGFVVVLDHRIFTRSYGKAFIEALPDIAVHYDEYREGKGNTSTHQ